MTIGQRIREARLGRQMTQQELVGDYITRNMLSKIENDAATPSVRTLEYLAGAMGLPPGVFLSDTPADPPLAGRIETLRQMLENADPQFEACLQEAKREWSETGLRLLELEAKYFQQKGLQSG
ncbi:MAG: helix-turn-helix domain-containing protein [Oscillospiraceae bacterium]|jgi:transcriptional regulator with XRE-family HTH domain|nr:helix-turn-helix domain-containing protein [Oscillospiraceae bacterium]